MNSQYLELVLGYTEIKTDDPGDMKKFYQGNLSLYVVSCEMLLQVKITHL